MQKSLFSTGDITVHGDVTVNNNVTDPAEPRDQHTTTLITATNKQWCLDIANAVSDATGDRKYGVSTVINEAVTFYRVFFKWRHILLQKRKAVIALIENL